ncbi:hypothetical protein [Caenibius sp. WL]|uniref:hypothetical protein n=1 Tax=Caenibius sp. WL TaxID=2872646 RepID=UPI001C99787C|nr:hypothetical protein [Caenibius sp. WL]QZP08451.1 hypothetical protein K5X80_01095 [Caenibius sp. WL]
MHTRLNLRFLVTSIILAVLIFAGDVAFHAMAVPNLYEGYPQRPAEEMSALFPFLFLTYLVQITMFLWLYLRLYPQRGIGRAVWWGLWGGLFVVLPNMQFFVGIAGTTWTLLWAQVVEAIVLLIIAAVLFDLVYPRTAAQSGQSLG